MSEETTGNEVETNPLQDMIQHAIDQNFTKANDVFNDMMTVKMSDLLDQEKIKLAGQIYNGEEPDEEDDDSQLELDLEAEDGDEAEEGEDLQEPDSESQEDLDDEENSSE